MGLVWSCAISYPDKNTRSKHEEPWYSVYRKKIRKYDQILEVCRYLTLVEHTRAIHEVCFTCTLQAVEELRRVCLGSVFWGDEKKLCRLKERGFWREKVCT